MLMTFDSTADAARLAASVPNDPNRCECRVSKAEAVKMAIEGDTAYVESIERAVEHLVVPMPETRMLQTVRGPFGAKADMGDWMAGSPTPMRRRVRRNSDVAPVKIVVCNGTSAELGPEIIERRGIAIMSLLLSVQAVRAVDLYVLNELQSNLDGWAYQLIRIESRPISLSAASFAICHEAFNRRICFAIASAKMAWDEACWPADYGRTGYAERRRQRIGLTDQDLLIGEAHYSDPMLRDPKGWIQEQMARWSGLERDGYSDE